MRDSIYIAVDLGAGSGRVFLVGLGAGRLLLEEAHRFYYPAAMEEGNLRWPFQTILNEIKLGLRCAGRQARETGCTVESVAVDGWGVDYGLIDAEGRLIENPVCYRDLRTQGMMEAVFTRVPRADIFERTGIQFLAFNTLFQMYAQAQTGFPDRAKRLLLIPDLINNCLTGLSVSEYTNATTTQLINARTGTWDLELSELLRLPSRLLPDIVPAGFKLSTISQSLATDLGLGGVPVIAGATHDTASAVAGIPLQAGWAYISSGTWSLVGVELDKPLINGEAALHNFTNEGGAFGTIRFLKNVMGLWILDRCIKEWRASGLDISYGDLAGVAKPDEVERGLIYPDDPRFFNPPSMLNAIEEQLAETQQPVPGNPRALALTVLDSLALRYASVLRIIERLTNQKIVGVQIAGGGSQNDHLNQATATATNLPVLAGPVEATVIGNALVQATAAGRFGTLAEARARITPNMRLRQFNPRPSAAWEKRALRYAELEARYATEQRL